MANETFCKPYEGIAISLKTKLHCEHSLKEMNRVIDLNDIKDATNVFLLINTSKHLLLNNRFIFFPFSE